MPNGRSSRGGTIGKFETRKKEGGQESRSPTGGVVVEKTSKKTPCSVPGGGIERGTYKKGGPKSCGWAPWKKRPALTGFAWGGQKKGVEKNARVRRKAVTLWNGGH